MVRCLIQERPSQVCAPLPFLNTFLWSDVCLEPWVKYVTSRVPCLAAVTVERVSFKMESLPASELYRYTDFLRLSDCLRSLVVNRKNCNL